VRYFIVARTTGRWSVTERRTAYRAPSRAALSDALRGAGFDHITWQMPGKTGFSQPIVSART